jgi:hypothetical protein
VLLPHLRVEGRRDGQRDHGGHDVSSSVLVRIPRKRLLIY